MQFTEELNKALALKRALEMVINGCKTMHPEYLLLNGCISTMLIGVIPVFIVECEDGEDGECEVTGRDPWGGLWNAYKELLIVVTTLEDEIAIEVTPDFIDGSEYDI